MQKTVKPEEEFHSFSPEDILGNSKSRKRTGFKPFSNIKRRMDGFICRISEDYRLHVRSLWREFRSQIAFGAVSIVTAAAICAAVNSLHYKLGYEVFVDGENIGMVTDSDTVYAAISEVSDKIGTYLGESYDKTPVFVRRLVSTDNIVDKDEICSTLLSEVDAMVDCYAVYIDGKPIFGVSSNDAANWVLNKYKQKYTGEEITDDMVVDFCEKTEVKKDFLHVGMLETPEEALDILSGNSKELASYTVQPNDTLWGIAAAYDTTVEHLLAINENLSENIRDGITIKVEESVPLLSVRTVQTASLVEPIPYEVEKVDDNTIYKNTTVVAQQGQNGEARVLARITKVNGVEQDRNVLETETITAPVKQIEKVGTKERPATTGSGTFARPTYGSLSSRYGSRWGRRHTGIDIAGSYNSSIKAADGGVVTYAGWMSGYGNYVVINHENGYQTGYGHCASLTVKVGDRVAKGDEVAKMGNTGRSTGTHLHFEVKKNGSFVDPLTYVGY